MAPFSSVVVPSQQTFRSLRRHAAKQKQDSTILQLRLELASARSEIAGWLQWWHAYFDSSSAPAAQLSSSGRVDVVLTELIGVDSEEMQMHPDDTTQDADVHVLDVPDGLETDTGSGCNSSPAAADTSEQACLLSENMGKVFKQGSVLDLEMQSEAAVFIQHWYRSIVSSYVSDAGDGADGESDSCSPDENSLEVVWMSLSDYKSKFFPLLATESFREYHLSGFRDFDAGVWYRILVHDDDSNTGGHDEGKGNLDVWDDAEIAVWVKVSLRTAGSIDRRAERLAYFESRWTCARPRIPTSKLGDMEVMIGEMRGHIEGWPEFVGGTAASHS